MTFQVSGPILLIEAFVVLSVIYLGQVTHIQTSYYLTWIDGPSCVTARATQIADCFLLQRRIHQLYYLSLREIDRLMRSITL